MDINSLMWEGASRDFEDEQRELARTAALTDAERLVGDFVYRAADDTDLANRLGLVEAYLTAVASRRDYPREELTADLARRWQLLSTARKTASSKTATRRQVTAAQERGMDMAVAALAAHAARENPHVAMKECLRLASEAVRKHADAYPLAYESWGNAADGPFTERAKHWQPPMPGPKRKAPAPKPENMFAEVNRRLDAAESQVGIGATQSGAKAPAAASNPGMFDQVKQRLDAAESRVGMPPRPAGPSRPAGPGVTASLDPTVAAMFQRLKDWWRGPSSNTPTPPVPSSASPTPVAPAPAASSSAPAPTPVAPSSAPAATPESQHVGPYDPTGWRGGAPRRFAEDAADTELERQHDEAGRREFDEIMNRLNNDQEDMGRKWDTPGYNDHRDWRTRRSDADRWEQTNDARSERMERHLDELGTQLGHKPTPIQDSLFD